MPNKTNSPITCSNPSTSTGAHSVWETVATWLTLIGASLGAVLGLTAYVQQWF